MVNEKFDFLITGCGRSGTGYMSKMLTDNGIKCGHENFFGVFSRNRKRIKFSSESSWLAVPKINDDLDANFVKIFRNPIENIKSNVDLLLFSPKMKHSPYQKYIIEHIKEIDVNKKTSIENAALYYIVWNELFEKKIHTRYYELIHFNTLITLETINMHNVTFKTITDRVNTKKTGKFQNIDNGVVINKLKKNEII